MRGEHEWQPDGDNGGVGSPPHARGARGRVGRLTAVSRITPAFAGSTCRPERFRPYSRDHPRMRGEHITGWDLYVINKGSPPHARGALGQDHPAGVLAGITPACAGSTPPAPSGSRAPRDHPRMRGEHSTLRAHRPGHSGSPPHARGAPGRGRRHGPCRRITPACAGSTRARAEPSGGLPDHPRMRGEHASICSDPRIPAGSPPHARGARCRWAPRRTWPGITPACAGSTEYLHRCPASCLDHPRMRGEHTC